MVYLTGQNLGNVVELGRYGLGLRAVKLSATVAVVFTVHHVRNLRGFCVNDNLLGYKRVRIAVRAGAVNTVFSLGCI